MFPMRRTLFQTPSPKTDLTIELANCFLFFASFIGCRESASEDKEETGFKNICFQCFNKKKMIKQITFCIGSPFRGVIESPVKEFLDL